MRALKAIRPLLYRELLSQFCSPIAYVVLVVFLLLSGYFFSVILNATQEASMRYTFSNLAITLLFLAPALTMRLFSEEKKSGTLEVLMTAPVTEWEVVFAKFMGGWLLYLFILLPTVLYGLLLMMVGQPDLGALLTGYAGLALIGAVFVSIGLFASALTSNQVIAAVLSFFILLGFWIVSFATPETSSVMGKLVGTISLFEHYDTFRRGIIDTRDVIYYVATTALFLFLTVRVLESRRWR
jgi:ABC-2 type transport system permease protein